MRNFRKRDYQLFPVQKFQKEEKEGRKEEMENIFGGDIFFFFLNPKHRLRAFYFYMENLCLFWMRNINIHPHPF